MPAVGSSMTGNCVVVIRYSNMDMTEISEYQMLPCLRQHGEHNSNKINGFSDVFQQALRERLDIKLVDSSGTSLLKDGTDGQSF